MTATPSLASYDDFKVAWFEDVLRADPSSTELGRRFATKVVQQSLDVSDSGMEFIDCDGANDGGVDIAVLDTSIDDEGDGEIVPGNTWYLVQSKYGSAFQGSGTLLVEGQKVIETLEGKRTNLNSFARGLSERLSYFRNGAGPGDKIILMFATIDSLSESDKSTLENLRLIGRNRLGSLFDVETISVEQIYQQLKETEDALASKRLTIALTARLVQSGPDLLVGSTQLSGLYNFLKAYRTETGDLDRLYEKNVRRFLGRRGKVNKAMYNTLSESPDKFGFFNNGITLVVNDYIASDDGYVLVEPYIVNGCQTTRTIWEVFHNRLDSGSTGLNPEIAEWQERAAEGVVVVKVARVGDSGTPLLQTITRYTNSQNAIRDKDFLALTGDFKTWQEQLGKDFGLYLEIQRGGWDSQSALQRTNPYVKRYNIFANAADLLKVYGAGWLGEAGTAFGRNAPFLPDGSIFRRIMNESDSEGGPFGAVDLYAAYLLQLHTQAMGFGRGAANLARRQTRMLYFMVVLELFRDVLSRGGLPTDNRLISMHLIRVLEDEDARVALLDRGAEVIEGYFAQTSDDNIFSEPVYVNSFNSDLNRFLKWERIGKSEADTPRLRSAITINKAVMGKSIHGVSERKLILAAIDKANEGSAGSALKM